MKDQAKKQAVLKSLRRIEGQVRGLQSMVEEDRYCIDVLIQVQAVRAALTQVGLAVLEQHAKGCVTHAVQQGNSEIIDEMLDAIKKFMR
ncbi:MAG: metal-sensitive transcriptional regulator [Negativicutes bacterium]|nr:metal-sensitive transcriptional regulator [Negativicutes bacterium]